MVAQRMQRSVWQTVRVILRNLCKIPTISFQSRGTRPTIGNSMLSTTITMAAASGFSFNFALDEQADESHNKNGSHLSQQPQNRSHINNNSPKEEVANTIDFNATERPPCHHRRPFVWCQNLHQQLVDRSLMEMVCNEVPKTEIMKLNRSETNRQESDNEEDDMVNTEVLVRYIDVESSTRLFPNPNQTTGRSFPSTHTESSDLEPGVYEGGAKVWEGSLDLVRFLADLSNEELFGHDNNNNNSTTGSTTGNFHILELGCGHALPACYLLTQVWQAQQAPWSSLSSPETAQKKEHDDSSSSCSLIPPISLTLVDYNDFVIQDVTVSNLVLNTLHESMSNDERLAALERLDQMVQLGSGDWMDLSQQLLILNDPLQAQQSASEKTQRRLPGNGCFHIILAAETLYSTESTESTALFLSRHLSAAQNSCCYLATKRYYFGVGGGSHALQEAAVAHGLVVEVVRTIDHGAGNIRELLKVTKRA